MKNLVQLDTHYTRSINLERDVNSGDVLKAYIPTSRAIQVLEKISQTFNDTSTPRAWSLVGPYGSGKSSFAVFLSHLLENQKQNTSKIAREILQKYHPELANLFAQNTNKTNAYCIVLITGSPEPLSKRFIEALYESAILYFRQISKDKAPSIVEKLEKANHLGATTSEIIDLVQNLKLAISLSKGKGIVIVIDELGKFLEYEARHQGKNDIFLLQALAELALQGGDANLLLVVLMHQAFEKYSKGISESFKNEWQKVQGRFENIPFLESAEQTLRVISAAFQSKLSSNDKQLIVNQTTTIIQELKQRNALPSGLTAEIAIDLLSNCYPLHPITTLLLPTLCQKVAQNERTLFSYLGSQERFGFRDSLSRIQNVGDWVLPWEIFEYFIENQPSATTDHLTHRRWAEVVSAIEKLSDADDEEIQLLKTIGLFNIIGRQAGLKASSEIITLCFPLSVKVHRLLSKLQKKSIINYRKYSSEYRVWEGSDFDLDTALLETTQQLGQINLAETLTSRNKLLPIVARKYSIQNGVLRYFQPFYADIATPDSYFAKDSCPKIIFLLADGQDEQEALIAKAKRFSNPLFIYVLCEGISQLKQIVIESIALEKIQKENAELKSDPVCQRELKERLQAVKTIETILLSQFLENSQSNDLFWRGNQTILPNKKQLQPFLSKVLETVFNKAPLIKNELINRDKISGQANAAKNKLIAALLNNKHLEDLGFEVSKYPAEKTIYRAVFKEPGIHVCNEGIWQFVNPPKNNKYRFYEVWQAIHGFLTKTSGSKKLVELYRLIEQPPYGVQKGVSSLLFVG